MTSRQTGQDDTSKLSPNFSAYDIRTQRCDGQLSPVGLVLA